MPHPLAPTHPADLPSAPNKAPSAVAWQPSYLPLVPRVQPKAPSLRTAPEGPCSAPESNAGPLPSPDAFGVGPRLLTGFWEGTCPSVPSGSGKREAPVSVLQPQAPWFSGTLSSFSEAQSTAARNRAG